MEVSVWVLGLIVWGVEVLGLIVVDQGGGDWTKVWASLQGLVVGGLGGLRFLQRESAQGRMDLASSTHRN